MPFPTGFNKDGRPSGARNIRTKEIIKKIVSNGFKDPLIVLSELASHSKEEGKPNPPAIAKIVPESYKKQFCAVTGVVINNGMGPGDLRTHPERFQPVDHQLGFRRSLSGDVL
jgi:hypothetical protein